MQDEHERLRLSLGIYVLGGLSAAENATVERHLASCANCSADADNLTEAVLALAVFTGPQSRGLADRYGVPVEPPTEHGPLPAGGLKWVGSTADGASLSVCVTGEDATAGIRATVSGLRSGVTYRLSAVTSTGQTRVAAEWLGTAGVQDVNATLPVAVDRLSRFCVTLADGTPVVSAHLPDTSPNQ